MPSLPVLLHRGPQPVVVAPVDVVLGLLAGTAGHHRLALVVDVQHELGGLVLGVAEQLLEHEHDVGHEVDGVVPDDHDPGHVSLRDLVALGGALAYRRGRAHAAHAPYGGKSTARTERTARPRPARPPQTRPDPAGRLGPGFSGPGRPTRPRLLRT